jgi:DNA-binding NarL/FixJ family response regulator
MIRTVIVSDVRLYVLGLVRLLENHPTIEAVGLFREDTDLAAGIESLQPQAVLLDRSMTDSLPLARAIVKRVPSVKVITISAWQDEAELITCMEAGVAGCVGRPATIEELTVSVESALNDGFRCSATAAVALAQRLALLSNRQAAIARQLTVREQGVLEQLREGCSNKEIAYSLHIEIATVKNHVHNILTKLGFSSRSEVAARFRGPGSLDADPVADRN